MNFSPQNVESRVRRVMSDVSLSRKEKSECLDQIRRTIPAWIRKYPLERLSELSPAQARQFQAGLRVVEAVHQLLVDEIKKQKETAK
jgi:hypothetical protein